MKTIKQQQAKFEAWAIDALWEYRHNPDAKSAAWRAWQEKDQRHAEALRIVELFGLLLVDGMSGIEMIRPPKLATKWNFRLWAWDPQNFEGEFVGDNLLECLEKAAKARVKE